MGIFLIVFGMVWVGIGVLGIFSVASDHSPFTPFFQLLGQSYGILDGKAEALSAAIVTNGIVFVFPGVVTSAIGRIFQRKQREAKTRRDGLATPHDAETLKKLVERAR